MVLVVIVVAMAICTITAGPKASHAQMLVTFVAFLLLEVAIGMYFPAISYAKSQAIPESHRANVMNWFRVPMNLITCATLLCLHVEWVAADKRIVFGACLVLAILGVFVSGKFIAALKGENTNGNKKVEELEESKQSLLDNEEEDK
jgi:uncharacterized membrane-anchored protein YitT (DUF2179 family)